MSSQQGSTGNVIAALCSLFVPGLGQLIQGRVLSAMFWFLVACIAFVITWLITAEPAAVRLVRGQHLLVRERGDVPRALSQPPPK